MDNFLGTSHIFKSLHGALDLTTLIPIVNMDKPSLAKIGININQIDSGAQHLGVNKKDIYYSPGSIVNKLMYLKDTILVDIYGLDSNVISALKTRELIDQTRNSVKNMIDRGDYVSLFSFMDKRLKIPMFIKLYDQIPKPMVYDIFIDLYIRSEYGFTMFPKKMITEVFELRSMSKNHNERMKKLAAVLKKDKRPTNFVVFRGQNTKSTPENDAFSWTLSEETARFFAHRFEEKGKIITSIKFAAGRFTEECGTVISRVIEIEQVIDYLDGRGEKEILILPINMRSKSYYKYQLKKMNTLELLSELQATYVNYYDYEDYEYETGPPSIDHRYTVKDIKEELATRPHVSRKKDRRKPATK